MKKDTSQIGQNARKAVKFLDEATSNPDVKVLIQGPDDQYQTWAQVEAYYTEAKTITFEQKENTTSARNAAEQDVAHQSKFVSSPSHGDSSCAQDRLTKIVANKLNISKEINGSPMSTPPLSPSSSGPQSSKTSPEVKSATMISNDLSPVPPTLKPLINPVVWYTHERKPVLQNVVFLTNSSDSAYLARDFGVASKNIHQLRAAIGVKEQDTKPRDKSQKRLSTPATAKLSVEPRTLFRYEEDDSEDEEVVFKPRGRGSSKPVVGVRGGNSGSVRSRGPGHSPANSLSGPPIQTSQPKPQIPIEEIDPDSFDRGSFARGSTPLVSVGNHSNSHFNSPSRGSAQRGNHNSGGQPRGGQNRGSARGFERGTARGRGRLFVP